MVVKKYKHIATGDEYAIKTIKKEVSDRISYIVPAGSVFGRLSFVISVSYY